MYTTRAIISKLLSIFLLFCLHVANTQEVGDSRKRKADSLLNAGMEEIRKGRFEEARNVFEEGLSLYQELNDDKFIGLAYNRIGIALHYQGNYHEAVSNYRRSIQHYEKVSYQRGMSSVLNNLGAIYYYKGSYPQALDFYLKALSINKAMNNEAAIAMVTDNIAGIYMELGDHEKAMQAFNESLELNIKNKDTVSISKTHNGIGETYMKQKRFEKAYSHFQQALELANLAEDQQSIIEALFSMGNASQKLGNPAQAIDYYNRCLTLSNLVGSAIYQASSVIALGNMDLERNWFSQAIASCSKGLKLAEDINATPLQKEACDCLYKANKENGSFGSALVYFEKAMNLQDSMKATETSNKILSMEFQREILLDSIAHVEEQRELRANHQIEMARKKKQRDVLVLTAIVVLLFAGGVWSRLNFVKKSKARLQLEKDRSESLLLNILPEEIADELKEKGYVDARDYEHVAILFTDFKSFTETSARLSPQELVAEINTCFRAFDIIVGKYQLEKIKTIGDAYMAAAGLRKSEKSSLKRIVMAGLAMQEFVCDRKKENNLLGKPAFEMRLGIHQGPIVAGVVGVKKFQYDVWGDTVNTASRMESNGEVGKVNISESLYQLIKDDSDFCFEFRGTIEAKGKGGLNMYFVSISESFEQNIHPILEIAEPSFEF